MGQLKSAAHAVNTVCCVLVQNPSVDKSLEKTSISISYKYWKMCVFPDVWVTFAKNYSNQLLQEITEAF